MKKATIMDIAKKVEVSKTTVSMVLNKKQISVSEETKNKIFKAAQELNYIPNGLARSLSTKKSNTIGFIIPDIQNPFFSEIAKAIEIEAEKYGYSIILCNSFNSGKKEEEYITLLISKLVDGVIMVPNGKSVRGIELLKKNNVPFVIVDRRVSDKDGINGVFCDNENGIKIGIEYLINKGNKNIAFVAGNQEGVANRRLDYFKEISQKHNVFNEELIEIENFSMEGGIEATEKLIKNDIEIDAIFYSSDVMAIGGMKYLLRNGYNIPQDISILGYDNIGICSFVEPELTTIAQPIYKMGEEAFKLLVEVIKDKNNKEKIINLTPYLVERKTIK